MLRLERHLTDDELLALRDGRDDDFVRVSHLEGCARRQKRLGFLSAFKAAVQTSLEAAPPAKPAEDHPDPATLAAYFDGALKGRERSRVQRHLLG